jgi:sporulation protein YlmC with PRC-barrel domain
MQTYVASRKATNAMTSDCVEGTPVRSAEGTTIGTIERVIIDKASGNVSHAVLSFNGSVQMGRRHLAVPWHGLTYDGKTATYNLELAENDLIAPGDRGRKSDRCDDRVQPYWGIAETW